MRIPADFSRAIFNREYLLKLAAVFVAYWAAGKLGLQVPFTDLNVSPVWPAAGVAVAAVLIWGYRVWPGIAAGAFCVNFFSPIPHPAAFGMALGNTASALVAGYLLNRIRGFDKRLHRLRDVLLLCLIGSTATVVAATAGTTTLYVNGLRPWAAFSSSWLIWWAGDSIGVLLFAPFILSASEALLQRTRRQRIGEGAVLISGALLVCGVVFGEHLVSKTVAHVVAFGLFPFVMWAALRFGILGTSLLSSGLALITVWQTADGRGPFAESAPLSNAALLQVFLALISLTGMVLAVVVQEREAAEDRLAREKELIRERDQAEVERRHAEAALLRNEKLAAAGTLAATIAHEIRNPLSAITNTVYLLNSASLPADIRQLVALLATEV
ncbi:MAG TPA: MASE1 domain-containing protein, partial [Terriglobales bacterium]|nr:MASE1 domain-containing protein [Terriglobales bacterium]